MPIHFTFDWSINIGNLLTIGAILIAFWTAHSSNVRRLQDMETKINTFWEWFRANILSSRGQHS